MSCDRVNGCPPETHNLQCRYPQCAKGEHDTKIKLVREAAAALESITIPLREYMQMRDEIDALRKAKT